jgi:hypothetical protein
MTVILHLRNRIYSSFGEINIKEKQVNQHMERKDLS